MRKLLLSYIGSFFVEWGQPDAHVNQHVDRLWQRFEDREKMKHELISMRQKRRKEGKNIFERDIPAGYEFELSMRYLLHRVSLTIFVFLLAPLHQAVVDQKNILSLLGSDCLDRALLLLLQDEPFEDVDEYLKCAEEKGADNKFSILLIRSVMFHQQGKSIEYQNTVFDLLHEALNKIHSYDVQQRSVQEMIALAYSMNGATGDFFICFPERAQDDLYSKMEKLKASYVAPKGVTVQALKQPALVAKKRTTLPLV